MRNSHAKSHNLSHFWIVPGEHSAVHRHLSPAPRPRSNESRKDMDTEKLTGKESGLMKTNS